jgi:hypothetical protein
VIAQVEMGKEYTCRAHTQKRSNDKRAEKDHVEVDFSIRSNNWDDPDGSLKREIYHTGCFCGTLTVLVASLRGLFALLNWRERHQWLLSNKKLQGSLIATSSLFCADIKVRCCS